MKAGPKRTENWGLTLCSQSECSVCVVLGHQPDELRQLRDLYIAGYPEWLLARTFNVRYEDLNHHGWRRNWYRRRSLNLPDRKHLWNMAALARLRDTWHLAGPYSADRMIELLGKSVGIGQNMKVKVESKMTFEQLLMQSIRDEPKRGAEAMAEESE